MAQDAPHKLEVVNQAATADAALVTLSEPIRGWFRSRFSHPTPTQRLAWPVLAQDKNLLLCAPTGTGKTLAAFLPVVSQLAGQSMTNSIRCLYISPLKALTNDVRRSLRVVFRELRGFLPDGIEPPTLGMRTGDASSHTRRKLLLAPPDILLTTPESLAVLLTQPAAGDLFGGLRWIIVDEIHALAPTKRGADLSLSLERLHDVAGADVQRIGLSASCAPVRVGADFVAGTNRPCAVVQVPDMAAVDLRIEPLADVGPGFVNILVSRLQSELLRNHTTLIFANARGLAERLAWALRRRFPHWTNEIAVHHSALARRVRQVTERQLKAGSLRVVISSTSLELGIDIGSVDGVVLVHPPGGVSRFLQRIGRGGHAPGRVRRGLILTATPAELLEATVTAASSRSAQYDPLRLACAPLDVLCQHLLGMAAQRSWHPDEAFNLVRRAAPYRDLDRADFDACLDYLSGRHRGGQSWLPARLRWDGSRFTLADDFPVRLLRRNLGSIVTEEARPVRSLDDAPVGQVDEPFADRLLPGDRFVLNGRCYEFKREKKRTLQVEEVAGHPRVPQWTGESWPLAPDLARRLYLLRTLAADALRDGAAALEKLLRRDYGCADATVTVLMNYFMQQECLSEIPGPATLLIECLASDYGTEYAVHTPLNRAGNDALARVAALRLARDHRRSVTSTVADLGFLLTARGAADLNADVFRSVFSASEFDDDLASALRHSRSLRDRFGRVALTGLMLLRNPAGGRRRVGGRDWAARRLFDQVRAADPSFPLLRQAEREVREQCCDAAAAKLFIEAMSRLTVRLRWLSSLSPFAANWTQETAGAAASTDSPMQALEQLHALLTGAGQGA
jgi:ATP-dependent Lhr-like helicase